MFTLKRQWDHDFLFGNAIWCLPFLACSDSCDGNCARGLMNEPGDDADQSAARRKKQEKRKKENQKKNWKKIKFEEKVSVCSLSLFFSAVRFLIFLIFFWIGKKLKKKRRIDVRLSCAVGSKQTETLSAFHVNRNVRYRTKRLATANMTSSLVRRTPHQQSKQRPEEKERRDHDDVTLTNDDVIMTKSGIHSLSCFSFSLFPSSYVGPGKSIVTESTMSGLEGDTWREAISSRSCCKRRKFWFNKRRKARERNGREEGINLSSSIFFFFSLLSFETSFSFFSFLYCCFFLLATRWLRLASSVLTATPVSVSLISSSSSGISSPNFFRFFFETNPINQYSGKRSDRGSPCFRGTTSLKYKDKMNISAVPRTRYKNPRASWRQRWKGERNLEK